MDFMEPRTYQEWWCHWCHERYAVGMGETDCPNCGREGLPADERIEQAESQGGIE